MLLLDGVSLTIAEACTGVRMLLAIVVVVYALCFSIQSSNAVKWCLLIFSPIIAMALNIVRLIATVACYSFYDTGTAEAFHDASGWIIPAFFILGVVFYTRQFDLPPLPNLRNSEAQNTHSYVGAICAALLMMIMVRNSYVPPSRVAIANHRASVEKLVLALPYVVGNWIADEQDLHPQEIKLLKPIASFRRKYHNVVTGDIISMVAIATSHGRDLIGHEPGICFVGQGWCKISQQPTHWTSESSLVNGVNYRFAFPEPSSANQIVVSSILIVPDVPTTGNMHQLSQAASDIRTEPFGAVAIQLSSNNAYDEADWHRLTSDFVKHLQPLVCRFDNPRSQSDANTFHSFDLSIAQNSTQ
jgi:exosortase/archaeosortase family protein